MNSDSDKIDPMIVNKDLNKHSDDDTSEMTKNMHNPSDNKTFDNNIFDIALLVFALILLTIILYKEFNFYQSFRIFNQPFFLFSSIQSFSSNKPFFSLCQSWISSNKTHALSILKRQECIWAKLWKEVS
mgnify:CR=1 FL=1